MYSNILFGTLKKEYHTQENTYLPSRFYHRMDRISASLDIGPYWWHHDLACLDKLAMYLQLSSNLFHVLHIDL